MALTNNGEIYTFGLGVFGQLGHGELRDELFPRRIDSLVNEGKTIKQVMKSNSW